MNLIQLCDRIEAAFSSEKSMLDDGVIELIQQLADRTAEVKQNATDMRNLRECMGYVENGTHTFVTLFQDEGTRDFFVRVGPPYRRYYGRSLSETLAQAYEQEKQE